MKNDNDKNKDKTSPNFVSRVNNMNPSCMCGGTLIVS